MSERIYILHLKSGNKIITWEEAIANAEDQAGVTVFSPVRFRERLLSPGSTGREKNIMHCVFFY